MQPTKSYDWTAMFREMYDKALVHYQKGGRDVKAFFTKGECEWLESIGCRPMEMYDFAEDHPDLDPGTALLITSARRDYFLNVMGGVASAKRLDPAEFPAKDDEAEGIRWLPRIILKAKAKLRGEMPDSLMFDCGGDRNFLKKFDIHPADFLRFVWGSWDDERRIVEYVKSRQDHKPAGLK